MLSRWILIVWWGVAALGSAGHLVFFNLVDSDDDLTWWGPIFVQFMICTAWALVTRWPSGSRATSAMTSGRPGSRARSRGG